MLMCCVVARYDFQSSFVVFVPLTPYFFFSQLKAAKRAHLEDVERRQADMASSVAMKLKHMESNASQTVSQLEKERHTIWSTLDAAARELAAKELQMMDKVQAVENQMKQMIKS